MPVITRFYGIIIKMYFAQAEHNPPHIHAVYGEYNGVIEIQTMNMREGDLPAKAIALSQEWIVVHQKELLDMWKTQEFRTLPPLE